jgi:hypothetical protein
MDLDEEAVHKTRKKNGVKYSTDGWTLWWWDWAL